MEIVAKGADRMGLKFFRCGKLDEGDVLQWNMNKGFLKGGINT